MFIVRRENDPTPEGDEIRARLTAHGWILRPPLIEGPTPRRALLRKFIERFRRLRRWVWR